MHRSKLEAKVCQDLFLRQRAGDIKDYRIEIDIPLVVNGIKITTYRADFIVEKEGEKPEIIEAKGMELGPFKIKWRLLEALHGDDYKLTMVKG